MAGVPLPQQHYIDKFWASVEKTSTCWLWTKKLNPAGYGQFYAGVIYQRGSAGKTYAHRYAYELMVGPIPQGYDIDHLCRVRNCVRPDHLEAVTHRENMLRGDTIAARMAARTHCNHGHELDAVGPTGRYCSTCTPKLGHYRDRTHCKRGHPFDEVNTYWFPDGSGRGCRTCRLMHANRAKVRSA